MSEEGNSFSPVYFFTLFLKAENFRQEPLPERQPYRAMPSAQTVLLQLCPPENRYLHR